MREISTESISGRRGLGTFPTRTLKLLVARAVAIPMQRSQRQLDRQLRAERGAGGVQKIDP